mgnify:CR=1 FL=1
MVSATRIVNLKAGEAQRRAAARILALTTLTLVFACAQADVMLSLPPGSVVEGESFELTFLYDESDVDDPDLSPLERDFELLGRSSSTSISIVNGRTTRENRLTVSLIPKRAGTLEIPPIDFGRSATAARQIEVLPAGSDVGAGPPEVIVEIQADKLDPYVQEQVIVTMRLLRRVEISNASLSEPETDRDVVMKKLGDQDSQYRRQRNGQRYFVHERKFAVFPQESGPLTLGPSVFQGQVISGTRSFMNPFGQAVSTRRVRSNVLTLDVRPIPAAFQGDVWLPARRVDLHEDYSPDVTELEVGEPMVRTLFLWVDGLTGGQLPEFEFKAPDGITLYPEPAEINDQEATEGLSAVRQQEFALIPSRSGEFELPALEVPWWNVETDRQEIARVPVRRLVATGGAPAASMPPPASGPAPAPAPDAPAADVAPPPAAPAAGPGWSVWLAAFASLGWLVTAVVLALVLRRDRSAGGAGDAAGAAVPGAVSRYDAERACRSGDQARAREAVLGFARAVDGPAAPTSLGAMAAHSPLELAEALRSLEAALYAPAAPPFDGEALAQRLALYQGRNAGAAAGSKTPLPALFPLVEGRASG